VIAALYVQTGGVYYGLDDVDPWDEARDARLYDGPWPVVAHPPCAAWSRYAPAREGAFGLPAFEDGGCFEHALNTVRAFGGVLEHPAKSYAWGRFGLSEPTAFGGWQLTVDGEWIGWCDQASYGHRMRKETWLLYVGEQPPPRLRFAVPDTGRTVDGVTSSWRIPTPLAFRDVLLSMARSALDRPEAQGIASTPVEQR